MVDGKNEERFGEKMRKWLKVKCRSWEGRKKVLRELRKRIGRKVELEGYIGKLLKVEEEEVEWYANSPGIYIQLKVAKILPQTLNTTYELISHSHDVTYEKKEVKSKCRKL